MESQLRFLREFGFRTIFAAVPSSYTMGTSDNAWEQFLLYESELGADEVVVARIVPLTAWQQFIKGSIAWLKGYNAMHWRLAPAELSAPPLRLLDIAAKEDVALVVCNHVYAVPFARKLQAVLSARNDRVPLLVVTHDVQSHILLDQKATTPWASAPLDVQTLLGTETQWLSYADGLIHNSYQDHEFFRLMLPDRKHFLMFPAMPKSQPANGPYKKERDLIYVGVDHVGNIASLKWYFDEVIPHFQNRPPKLTIVGQICKVVPEITAHLDDTSWIELVPTADDVAPYYSSARAALGVVTSGRGISIKTVEALANGVSVAGTKLAFRGIPQMDLEAAGMIWADSSEDYASLVRKAIEPQMGDKLRQAGDALYEKLFRPATASAAFRRALCEGAGIETSE